MGIFAIVSPVWTRFTHLAHKLHANSRKIPTTKNRVIKELNSCIISLAWKEEIMEREEISEKEILEEATGGAAHPDESKTDGKFEWAIGG